LANLLWLFAIIYSSTEQTAWKMFSSRYVTLGESRIETTGDIHLRLSIAKCPD